MQNSDSSNILTPSVRILVIALSGIGNLLMQMPTIETLKRKRPDCHITLWVAPRGTKKLAESLPYVDEVIEAPIKNSLADHIRLIRKLRHKHFTVGIILSPGQLIKSAAYLWLAGIPTRIGNSYPFHGNSHSRWLLTDAIDEDPNLHDIEQNLRLLTLLSINPSVTPHYSLLLDDLQSEQAKKIIDNLGIQSGRKLIGFHMGSAPDFSWKRWPQQNFITLGSELIAQQNAQILLFGGPDEADSKQTVAQALGQYTYPISADLLTTAAVMKECRAIVSNDSGLMHLGAAVGAKVFGLFGPTDEKHTGPRGLHSSVIRAPGTTPVYNTEKNYHLGGEPHTSMKAITPQMVLEKILI